MATLIELFSLLNNSDLQDKVAAACLVAAENIRNEDPATANHAGRLLWAKRVFEDPRGIAVAVLRAVLAANSTATVQQIQDATDAAIQTNVDAAVDIFATGG